MEVNATTLAKFRDWLTARGRSSGTAALYSKNVEMCSHDASMTARLVGGELAPKSKHANAAALRAWAKFAKDQDLADIVADIRLPPAQRLKAKLPLEPEAWKVFVVHTRKAKWIRPHLRAVVLIMAIRGLRSGDSLRIKRAEVKDGLKTGKLSFEGKGRKRHEIAVAPIRAELEELAAQPQWERVSDLFGKIGDRSVSNRVARTVKRLAKECKVEGCHPHRLRRTVAHRFLVELGPDPLAMAKLLKFMGWSNVQTAMSYVGEVDQGDIQDVGSKIAASLV